MPNDPKARFYPSCCTSAYCGKSAQSCPGCRNYPTIQDFIGWKNRTNAKQSDPIWSPLYYEAGKEA